MAPAHPLPIRTAASPRRAAAARLVVVSALLGLLFSGCFTSADGRQPKPDTLHFPTGLVVSPGRNTLYVANSDFDLSYSGGWVQALNLNELRARVGLIPSRIAAGDSVAAACGELGVNDEIWLNPGPCAPIPVGSFIERTALVGAFSSGLLLVHRPDGQGARLFDPVRGDPSITYFDVADDRDPSFSGDLFRLDCEPAADGFCGAQHRIGQDRENTLRGIQLPADPVGIAATADGRAIVSAHQTQQAASLLINRWDGTPELTFFVNNLAPGPTEVATIPRPAFVELAEQTSALPFEYRDAFALTFRAAGEVDLLQYHPDAGASPARPFLTRAASTAVATNSSGFDSRGIALVDRDRRNCEAACAGVAQADALDCLVACAENHPIRVFVANRAPPSLLVGRLDTYTVAGENDQLTGAFDELFFTDTLPLTFGPSRVEVGQVVAADGSFVDRVFAVAFDSRAIFVVDPELERVEAVIRTGRGPHDIAIDSGVENGEPYSMLWVGHFTDSYLGVVDLDLRRPATYAQMIATVGQPTPPPGSK